MGWTQKYDQGYRIGWNDAIKKAAEIAGNCHTKEDLTCEVQKCEEISFEIVKLLRSPTWDEC